METLSVSGIAHIGGDRNRIVGSPPFISHGMAMNGRGPTTPVGGLTLLGQMAKLTQHFWDDEYFVRKKFAVPTALFQGVSEIAKDSLPFPWDF